ncbi:class I SAM-dependent methyltransferase [Yinghuangia seranimata]|uniref:class I SAM-dependent methyltransferase n=1 Tax=Yinghuangia seranimata TaxID=408067 RepID=UPI00248BB8C8|nr:class I SAM-dependent methyltransferase [Yinghuangia seranimata]MDI2126525.1 class I SAM-dependent methyltransferase [Yinghuangia seranimata]
MDDAVRFDPDLYQGTAGFYDRYRLPYPDAMTADLVRRTAPSGAGRLLDLACGTGQLTFPLRGSFAEVWAVDAEPDMTAAVRAKAASDAGIRAVTAAAEELDAEAGAFELVVIGNAFHRLDRASVGRRAFTWLRPGGHLALCWSTSPWTGDLDWQRALDDLLGRWKAALGAADRVPSGWDRQRRRDPDGEVLARAGFEAAGRRDFPTAHAWTVEELAGHVRSTSFLPPSVLADRGDAFDAELSSVLGPFATGGRLAETVAFAYDLFRTPVGG